VFRKSSKLFRIWDEYGRPWGTFGRSVWIATNNLIVVACYSPTASKRKNRANILQTTAISKREEVDKFYTDLGHSVNAAVKAANVRKPFICIIGDFNARISPDVCPMNFFGPHIIFGVNFFYLHWFTP
jgi:hypothetical protein